MSYNTELSDNTQESFEFSLRGVGYRMRYPLVEEIEKIQDISAQQQVAETADEKVALGKQMQEYMYSFISPTQEGSESIEEALRKSNIKVLQNFNDMVQSEFGVK